MKPDELLDDLGRLARAQAEQTATGDAAADELLRPLDAAAHDRIVARVLPLIPHEASPRHATETASDPRGSAQAVPIRPRSKPWLLALGPALAAAAVLLWFMWPRAEAPLPIYALELRGGPSAERGDAGDAIIRVGPGDDVSAVLRPATAVSGAVAVRVFVDGRALPDAPVQLVEQSADGAVRISGLGPALAALAPGRHRLHFAVARPGSLPEVLADTPPPSGAIADGLQLLSCEIERLAR